MPPTPPSHKEQMKQEMNAMIDAVELTELQKQFLRARWLDQLIWAGNRSNSTRDWYYRLRILAVVGGVLIPALVSLNFVGTLSTAVHGITFIISLLVGISVALEQFFNFGDRWRRYRQTSEMLKTEGWHFFELSGPYRRFDHHAEAFRAFAMRTESLIQQDVEAFLTLIAGDKEKKEETKDNGEEPDKLASR